MKVSSFGSKFIRLTVLLGFMSSSIDVSLSTTIAASSSSTSISSRLTTLANLSLANNITEVAALSTAYAIDVTTNSSVTQTASSLNVSTLLAIILPIGITFLIVCLILFVVLITCRKKRSQESQEPEFQKEPTNLKAEPTVQIAFEKSSLKESAHTLSQPDVKLSQPNGPVTDAIKPEEVSLKGQTIEELLLEEESFRKEKSETIFNSSANLADQTLEQSNLTDYILQTSSRTSSMEELANAVFIPNGIVEQIERTPEATVYIEEPVNTTFLPVQTAEQHFSTEPNPLLVDQPPLATGKYFLDFLNDFKVVFIIDDSSTMNEKVQQPIFLTPANPSKWDELKLIFKTLTELTPILTKSEIYLLDDKPLGMNSIDKIFKIVITSNQSDVLKERKLLIIFLTDARVKYSHDFKDLDNLNQTLFSLPSNVYTSIINFSEDKQTSEYLRLLSSVFPNVSSDDLSAIRRLVQQAVNSGNDFHFDYFDYLAKLLVRSACHLTL